MIIVEVQGVAIVVMGSLPNTAKALPSPTTSVKRSSVEPPPTHHIVSPLTSSKRRSDAPDDSTSRNVGITIITIGFPWSSRNYDLWQVRVDIESNNRAYLSCFRFTLTHILKLFIKRVYNL